MATEAKASKATMYRRWPSKADLVLAAFIHGTRIQRSPPRTGSLRGDLLAIGASVCDRRVEHASTMRAMLDEMSHSPALSAAMQDEFVPQRKVLITDVLTQRCDRGEIDAEVISAKSGTPCRDTWCSGR